jgi:hypothetical protein
MVTREGGMGKKKFGGAVRGCAAAAAVGGSGYQDVMARDQVQVSPEPTRPRINSCLFIPHNLLGLYSRVTRVLLGLKGSHLLN